MLSLLFIISYHKQEQHKQIKQHFAIRYLIKKKIFTTYRLKIKNKVMVSSKY